MAPDVLAEILDGGQAFRWNRVGLSEGNALDATDAWRRENPVWVGVWGDCVARVRCGVDGHAEWAAPAALADRVAGAAENYFATSTDFSAIADALPWRSDEHLAGCMAAFRGLRILRQPFGETLLGFLCSATKQIVQIKQMMAALAARHGTEIAAGVSRLPTWSELAEIPEAELRACLLGFRARHIAETSRFLAARPGWLEETEALPYARAKERLCELPGVGEKIADCALLFGAGRLEAFPVDVWILKTLERRYGLAGWRPAQLVQFGRMHFGRGAGLAQQFLFAWERREARRVSPRRQATQSG
jgi:N-glycosylase/DNA lyase